MEAFPVPEKRKTRKRETESSEAKTEDCTRKTVIWVKKMREIPVKI